MSTDLTLTAPAAPAAPAAPELRGVEWERAHYRRLLWLFPAAFAAHVAEESAGFPRWVTHVLGGAMDVRVFYVNNAAFMAVLLALCAAASRSRSRLPLAALFVWTTGQQFWNAVFHVYTQVVFNAYSPGVVSGVFLYLPVYGYLAYLTVRERHLPRAFFAAAMAAGAAGLAFTIWAGLYHFGTPPWCRWAPFACG